MMHKVPFCLSRSSMVNVQAATNSPKQLSIQKKRQIKMPLIKDSLAVRIKNQVPFLVAFLDLKNTITQQIHLFQCCLKRLLLCMNMGYPIQLIHMIFQTQPLKLLGFLMEWASQEIQSLTINQVICIIQGMEEVIAQSYLSTR